MQGQFTLKEFTYWIPITENIHNQRGVESLYLLPYQFLLRYRNYDQTWSVSKKNVRKIGEGLGLFREWAIKRLPSPQFLVIADVS